MANIEQILRMSVAERKAAYKAQNIEKVTIDGIDFTDYGAFSFLWEKSYVKSPVRSGDGSIGNLNSYATFATPHLKIDFSLMSIDSYRNLMKLIYSKNEFTVTCYDVVNNDTVTNKMYFSTEEMPKLWTIARAINGEEWVELLGVQDYSVEMVGTNNAIGTVEVGYYLCAPDDIELGVLDETYVKVEKPSYVQFQIGVDAIINIGGTSKRIGDLTFNDKYKFKYWAENENGTGFRYYDLGLYMLKENKNLYAVWEKSAE